MRQEHPEALRLQVADEPAQQVPRPRERTLEQHAAAAAEGVAARSAPDRSSVRSGASSPPWTTSSGMSAATSAPRSSSTRAASPAGATL